MEGVEEKEGKVQRRRRKERVTFNEGEGGQKQKEND